jgi:hypothetical protein
MRVTSPRPAFALARYHLLSGIRNAHGAFAITFVLALLPIVVGAPVFQAESVLWTTNRTTSMRASAQIVVVAYIFHLLLMLQASILVAAPRRRQDGRRSVDLTETVPISSAQRFLGDMLGVLACTLVIHICILPLLALGTALSPVSSSIFVWCELITIAFMILGAAGASWMRQSTGPWGRLRTVGSGALFALLAFLSFAVTTRWENFRDAAATFLSQPTPLRWMQMSREVMNPPLLATLLVALYLGFIAFYAIQSIRFLDGAEESLP